MTRETGRVVTAKSSTFKEAELAERYCHDWSEAAAAQGRAVTFQVDNCVVTATFTKETPAHDKLWVHALVTSCSACKSTHSSAAGM